jgi:phosphopantothenoylcysteine decarboxylase/phosphopantothenate--cysteine ligase
MEDHVRNPSLTGARIVLGVTGSIAAYKAVTLLRALVREGAVIDVAMTRSATKFVTPLFCLDGRSRQTCSRRIRK